MYDFKSMRNMELMQDYRKCLSDALNTDSYTSREAVIRKMLATSHPKFDVSYDYALRIMYAMIRDRKPCPAKGTGKIRMWEEIKGHVEETCAKKHCSIPEAVTAVLAEKRASRYFLSYKQASKIIYYELQNRRCASRRA